MKRTRQDYHQKNHLLANKDGISGCRWFDGEDRQKDERDRLMKAEQKKYLDAMIEEKKLYNSRGGQIDRQICEQRDNFLQIQENLIQQHDKN